MALTINIIKGCGLSNKVHHELRTTKEEQGKAVFAIYFTVKAI